MTDTTSHTTIRLIHFTYPFPQEAKPVIPSTLSQLTSVHVKIVTNAKYFFSLKVTFSDNTAHYNQNLEDI